MNDEALYAAGDVAALIARYRPSLVSYANGRTGDSQLAERIADDALGREFQPGRLFRPMLYATADQLCQPHDSPDKAASSDAAFAVLDYLEANAPDQSKQLFKEVCERAQQLSHPWTETALLGILSTV